MAGLEDHEGFSRMKVMMIILLVLLTTPANSASLISDPIIGIDYFLVVIDNKDYQVPPMGVDMLIIDLTSLDYGVHSLAITGYIEKEPLETVNFQLVRKRVKQNTVYMIMADEANAKYFYDPLTLTVKETGKQTKSVAEGGSSSSGGGCFFGTIF